MCDIPLNIIVIILHWVIIIRISSVFDLHSCFFCPMKSRFSATSNVCSSAPVWKWEPAAGVGQAGEWARGAGEVEEAAAPGAAGPGAGHRSQQGPHVRLLTGRLITSSFLPRSSQPSSWLQHQHWPDITKRPCYQFVCKTSDSTAVTGHMLNDSTFSSKLRFKAHWTTQQLYNHGQYGATWFGPGFILQKPQLFNTNQTCRSSYMRLIAACVWLCHQVTLLEKLFFFFFLKETFFKYT